MKNKFDKPIYANVSFSEKIWVKCPKCAKPTLVKTNLPKYTIPFPRGYKSVCNCVHCGFHSTENDDLYGIGNDDKKWFGYLQGFVNQRCSFCGAVKISYVTEPTKTISEFVRIKCSGCQNSRDYKLKWRRCRGLKPTDPYFGFDLYLQINIKGDILWLYNLAHLDYLKEYVEADLREDDGRHKYSIIANLPQWVKSKKNRDIIVKKLNKLKEEFEKEITQNKKI